MKKFFKISVIVLFGLLTSLLDVNSTELSGNIESDMELTVEESPYIITGDVNVFPGVTLKISPGVELRDGDYQIWNKGTLLVEGTEDAPVIFTSNKTDPAPGDWNRIFFDKDSLGSVAHAVIQYAKTGIFIKYASPSISSVVISNILNEGIRIETYEAHPVITKTTISSCAHGIYGWHAGSTSKSVAVNNCKIKNNAQDGIVSDLSYFEISNCEISDNKEAGIDSSSTGSRDAIIGNIITSNEIGVYVGAGYYTLNRNTITNNEIGIKLGNYPTSHIINLNNIHDNTQYDLVCEFTFAANIDAKNNWWGTTDKTLIDEHIWDMKDDFSLSKVEYEPFYLEPIPVGEGSIAGVVADLETGSGIAGAKVSTNIGGFETTTSGDVWSCGTT
jgi:ribosomal protein S19